MGIDNTGIYIIIFCTKFKETIKLAECESCTIESWFSENKMLDFVEKVTNSSEFKSDSIMTRISI